MDKFESISRVASMRDRADAKINDVWGRVKKVIMDEWIVLHFCPVFGDYSPQLEFKNAARDITVCI